MNPRPRSWIIFILWLVVLVLALALPGDEGNQRDILFNLTYLFSGILLLAWVWAWLSLRNVRLVRRLRANRSQVGKYVDERLTVQNRGTLPILWLEVQDDSELPQHRAGRVLNSLSGRQQRSWLVKTPCFRRGSFRIGPTRLVSGDPFGLFSGRKTLEQVEQVVVYPATYPLSGFGPQTGQLAGGETHRRRTHHVTANVAGVRDYAPGDSFNRIHWRSTARTDRLMVKEFELDPVSDIWLFLDMEQRTQAGRLRLSLPNVDLPSVLTLRGDREEQFVLDPSTEEYAVAITASLAQHFLAGDWAVGLITYDHGQSRQMIQADRGERQLDRLFSTLAVTHAQGSVPLTQVLTSDTQHLHRGTTAIVVTANVDPGWVAALSFLTLRGVRPMTVQIDPVTFGAVALDNRAAESIVARLASSHLPAYLVRNGDQISAALSRPYA